MDGTRRARRPYVLWVSTRPGTRGGIGSYVRTMAGTPLWTTWAVEHLATHRDGSAAAKALEFARGVALLCWRLLLRRPALVHVHMASRGSFARKALVVALCRVGRVPVVLHVHGGGFADFHDAMPAPVRALIRRTLSSAAAVVALGDRWAGRLRGISATATVVVVPNAVRPAGPAERDGHGTAPVRMVFLGDVLPQKGVFDLLEAWARLRPQPHVAHLTLAGAGEVERARSTAAELGVDTTVDVLGWIGSDQVGELLGSSDVLVLPSHAEGQPMAVLEAMGHGLCVVATDVGGIPDLVAHGSTGLLVPPSDVDALAGVLADVLACPERRDALGRAGRRRVEEEFAVDVVWRRVDQLYRDVLGVTGDDGAHDHGVQDDSAQEDNAQDGRARDGGAATRGAGSVAAHGAHR